MKSIGLKTMFDRTAADFSGISGGQLWVDRTVQKAFIKVLFHVLLFCFNKIYFAKTFKQRGLAKCVIKLKHILKGPGKG